MNNGTRYTMQLLSLECIEAQELDGDEIYITLNRQTLWKAHPEKMINKPTHKRQVRSYDFANGRKLMADGWHADPALQLGALPLPVQDGEVHLQVWDKDFLTSDDLLGDAVISARDAGRGMIMVVFERDGGHYNLTYRVDAE